MTTTPFDSPAVVDTSTATTSSEDVAYSADGKPDRYGRYRLPDPVTGEIKPWTRASTFAKSISDTYTLNQWGLRMAMKGLTIDPSLYALVAATPLEERDELDGLAEKAKTIAGAKKGSNLGRALHTFTEGLDRSEDEGARQRFMATVPAPWDADVKAYRAAMTAAGLLVVPQYIENVIHCRSLSLAGKFDRILGLVQPCPNCGAIWRIGDLKTGRDLSYGWNEIAVQLAVYARADSIFDTKAKVHREMPNVCPCKGVVMHLPVGKAKCDLYEVDIEEGWRGALLALEVRGWRKTRNLAKPLVIAEKAGQDIILVQPSWEDRVRMASSEGELATVWDEMPESEKTLTVSDLIRARLDSLRSETASV